MARQDANDAFALTSFLYGGNADYIEDSTPRYENDPGSVDADWQAFFGSLKDDRGDVEQERRGPVLGEGRLAADRPMANWSRRSTATGARSKRRVDDKVQGKAAGDGRRRSPAPTCSRRRAIRSAPS